MSLLDVMRPFPVFNCIVCCDTEVIKLTPEHAGYIRIAIRSRQLVWKKPNGTLMIFPPGEEYVTIPCGACQIPS